MKTTQNCATNKGPVIKPKKKMIGDERFFELKEYRTTE
ncbi:MAG: hypothetical protein ACI825_002003 [Planctomycetota bacterium]|jgi:hypothetical protein